MTRQSRARPKTSGIELAFNALLVITFALPFVGYGGVTPQAQSLTHVLLALTLSVSLFLPATRLARAGVIWRIVVAAAFPAVAMLTGFLPVPEFLGPLLSWAWTEERAGYTWTSSLDPARTLGALTTLALLTGFGAAVGLWSSQRGRRELFPTILIASAFVWLGTTAALFASEVKSLGEFVVPPFAPFINANHFGTLVLLLMPFALGPLIAGRKENTVVAMVSVAVAAMGLGLTLGTTSTGPLVLLILQGLVLLWQEREWRWWSLLGLLTGAVLLGGALLLVLSVPLPDSHGRLSIWSGSLWMMKDHWLLGPGAGTYDIALPPYRTDTTAESWPYAHNDWLEWITTTGLVGSIALLGMLAWLWPRPRRHGASLRYAYLGLGFAGAHAFLDFPMQIPAIAMATVAVLAWRMTAYDVRPEVGATRVRVLLALLALLQVPAALWQARTSRVQTSVAELLASPRGSEGHYAARAALERWAPHTAELLHENAIALAKDRKVDEARALALELGDRHRHHGMSQANVARLLLALKEPEAAVRYAEHAVTRAPSDSRTWLARAEVIAAAEPERAADAWVDALLRGNNAYQAAYTAVPAGMFWVDRLSGHPRELEGMLRFLTRLEPDTALLGYDELHADNPAYFPKGHAALMILYRPEDADAYLRNAMRVDPENLEYPEQWNTLMASRGDWEKAAEGWKSLIGRSPKALAQHLFAVEKLRGPKGALEALEQARSLGVPIKEQTAFYEADLHRRSGNARQCAEVLIVSGLLEDSKTRKQAVALRGSCHDAEAPPMTAPR